MIICFTNNYSIVVITATTRYEYGHISPYIQRKVRNYIKHGAIGRAWQILRKYPVWSKNAITETESQ